MTRRIIWGAAAAGALTVGITAVAVLSSGVIAATAQRLDPAAPATGPATVAPAETPTPTPDLDYTVDLPGRPDSDRPIIDALQADDVPVTHQAFVDFYVNAIPVAGWPCQTTLADCADARADADQLMAHCMAEAGFYYDPRRALFLSGLPYTLDSPEGIAMEGDTGSGDAYRWEDAGCVGLVAHHFE